MPRVAESRTFSTTGRVPFQLDGRGFLSSIFLLALFFFILLALHAPLLRLPYFWDEAGYYVPAARDLFLRGSLIPLSSPSNAHPPLVMVYLALLWKIFSYTPLVTRSAMLLIAAFSLLGLFRLAQTVANAGVAIASTLCTALYPVFFTQSSLAHVDLAAAGLTYWGLLAYVEERYWKATLWFSLAALAKETAILVPIALLIWNGTSRLSQPRVEQFSELLPTGKDARSSRVVALLFPLLPLALWYAYHYRHTGFVFGNPEFFRYNVQATLNPLRIVLALGMRLWQMIGYLGLWVLTSTTVLAMLRLPRQDKNGERPRIALPVQFDFFAVIVLYVAAMAILGGAVLARYLLPVIPLVIILCVSTLWRRVRIWPAVIVAVIFAFVAALFVNPPYGFSLEDNLAYRDYILLHRRAEDFIEAHYPAARVLTAWPANDELSRPYLGYVDRAMHTVRIENFTARELEAAAASRGNFDVALVFSTKYDPPHPWFENWSAWQQWKTQFFGYHRDSTPSAAAQIIGGHLAYSDHRNGQWIGVIEIN